MHKMEISDTLDIVGLLHRFRSSATTLTSLQEGEPSPRQRGSPGTDYIYHPGCAKESEYFGFSKQMNNLDELLFRYVSIVVNIQFSKDILQV